MPATWSAEQIIALAPDASSVKAGKELATPRRWVTLGQNQHAAWGECQGSGKAPYQTQIDFSDISSSPAFKCSCPSRKFPCKHALALFLLVATQSTAFEEHTPPAWVSEWLANRAAKANQKASKSDPAPTDPQRAKARAEKTSARRQARLDDGLRDLRLWLQDLIREGLAEAQSKPTGFWEAPAARLVDAQAPGLARRMRRFGELTLAGEGWQERILEQAASLYLLVDSYGRIQSLPEPIQAEIRQQIGFTENKDELLAKPGLVDRWLVLGQCNFDEHTGPIGRSPLLKVQRTWLWGQSSQRYALVLSFSAPGQTLDAGWITGSTQEAELVFYPGVYPLRALVKRHLSAPELHATLPGYANFEEAFEDYTSALADNPWIDVLPMSLNKVKPVFTEGGWSLQDPTKRQLPIAKIFRYGWQLLALAGDGELDIFGEWSQAGFAPLTILADGRWISYPVI